MMPTQIADLINEEVTAIYTATLTDEKGAAITLAALTAITLTFYDVATGTIINSRNGQDVLNDNNVTISAGGLLTWTMQQADNIIQTATQAVERHRALLEWNSGTPAKYGKHEVDFFVLNLTKVT